MIDTHAHLTTRFYDVVGGVAEEVKNAKMKVVLAAANMTDSEDNIKLQKENLGLYFAAIGIHPQDADEKQLDMLDKLANNNKLVAIGECGLDFSTPLPSGELQERVFCGQIELSLKYKLPLIIHARKANDEVIEILKKYPGVYGVFHCYSGGKKRIKKILELGEKWYFGIDGNLTYEDGLVEVVKNVPKDRLVLETDTPLLTPIPHRGETNRPIYVKFIYEKVAEIWRMSFEECEKTIDNNAETLFHLT